MIPNIDELIANDDIFNDKEYQEVIESLPIVKETTNPVIVRGKIEELDRKYSEILKKYNESTEQKDEKYTAIKIEELKEYKNVISELTGIKIEDIKDFVVNFVKSGISENKVDEKGNSISTRRPLADEEVISLVQHINNLSPEEVDKILNKNGE